MALTGRLTGSLLILTASTIARCLATLEAAVPMATCEEDCGLHGVCRRTPEGGSYCHCQPGFAYVIYQGCLGSQAASVASTSPPSPLSAILMSHSQTAATTPSSTTAATETTSSLYPVRERTCAPGYLCLHGRCALDTIGCQCDEGWSGVFCSERCTKNCTTHGRCMIHVDGTSYCACGWQYQGEFCQEEKTPSSTPAAPTGVIFPALPLVVTLHTATATTSPPAAGPTTPQRSLRADDQRTCLPGFVCVHGRCSPPPAPACVCDPGWGGLRCQTPCPLPCGPYGRCQTAATPTGEERPVCLCVAGYAGPRCETSTLASHLGPVADVTPSSSVDENAGARSSAGGWNGTGPGNHTLSDRECVVGLECLHGACKKGGAECLCDPGYIGTLCHIPCPSGCVHGECALASNGLATCLCRAAWAGDNCTERVPASVGEVPEEKSVQWYVVGACAVLPLAVLVVVGVAVPYWLWRRGHLLALRVVHHFRSYEDDDKKKYDAFISYSNADESFVLDHLYPKLTEMNFTVCVHKKDFSRGETVANNISEAVDSSRRTILVVTPDFLCSEFCRFEYQQAQGRMTRQRPRVVPIVVGKVEPDSPGVDPTLRAMLHTAPSLHWPGHRPTDRSTHRREVEKFWKRLELSMPKRKNKSFASGPWLEGCDSCDTALSSSDHPTLASCTSGYSTASCPSAAPPPDQGRSPPSVPRFSLTSASASSLDYGPSQAPGRGADSPRGQSLSLWPAAGSPGLRSQPPGAAQRAWRRAEPEGVDRDTAGGDRRGFRKHHVVVEMERKESRGSRDNAYDNLVYYTS